MKAPLSEHNLQVAADTVRQGSVAHKVRAILPTSFPASAVWKSLSAAVAPLHSVSREHAASGSLQQASSKLCQTGWQPVQPELLADGLA